MIFLVDCQWGPWSETNCNATCGNAHKNKTRQVLQKAAYGGKPCTGKSFVMEECKLKPCPGKHLPIYTQIVQRQIIYIIIFY